MRGSLSDSFEIVGGREGVERVNRSEGRIVGCAYARDFNVVCVETRCIDSNRLGVVRTLEESAARADRERTLTGWLMHNCAARERRNEREGRI